MKLLILKGLPASGKTTWAREFVKKNKDWIRVNRDDLRNMRGEYWIPKQEDLITRFEETCVYNAIIAKYNVILDATNLNPKYLDKWKEMANANNATIEYKKFDTDVDECIKRDMKRENSVGEKVIRGMHDKYLKPPIPRIEENFDLPSCIIVDIDGTLAHATNRGMYDWKKVIDDSRDHTIARLVYLTNNDPDNKVDVILMSGRDGICRNLTIKWLNENGIEYDHLYMRPQGNNEKDTIIKERLYKEYIEGKYNVRFVLDDRDCVVDMWRDLGLKCLQVAPGAF